MLKPTMLLAALAASLIPSSCAEEPTTQQPVIIILFDALSASHVRHLGYPRETTPNLDAFAASGVSYARAFAPAPYTLASIPSLMTGTLPDRHKVVQVERALSDQATTLAEGLSTAGYETFGAVANIKGSSLHGFDQGFDVFEELYLPKPGDPNQQMRIVQPDAFPKVLKRWIAERDTSRAPFFYLHVLQPHLPYTPPPEHRDLWIRPEYTGRFASGLSSPDMVEFIKAGGVFRELSPEQEQRTGKVGIMGDDRRALRDLYDANIHYADAALEDIFAILKAAGLFDPALILVTSDHGESFWEHGEFGHNAQVYDETLRVPLVLKFPEGQAPINGVQQALVSTLDITPTVLRWLDLPATADYDGRALAGVFEAADDERSLLLRNFHEDPIRALRSSHTKVVIQPPHRGAAQKLRAYDLRVDWREERNLVLEDSKYAQTMFSELRARYGILQALPDPSASADETTATEADLIQKLGYTK